MFYTIYKITNKINNKYYIGKHQTQNLDDGYMGSGKLIKFAIAKYGIENFSKEILHVFDNEKDMNAKEKELVVISEETYNLCPGGKGGFGYINENKLMICKSHAFASRNNLKKANQCLNKKLKNQEFNFLFRNKISIGLKSKYKNCKHHWAGKKHTLETKLKMSLSHTNKGIGSKNSQFGTCWITNGHENKKIKKDDLDKWIELGYRKGRILN